MEFPRTETWPGPCGLTIEFTIHDEEGEKCVVEFQRVVRDYFANFVEAVVREDGTIPCVCDDGVFGGVLSDFRWGLAHGEGYCVRCRRRVRARHVVRTDLGTIEIGFRPLVYKEQHCG